MNRSFVLFLPLAGLLAVAASIRSAESDAALARAREIHRRIITFDTHVDVPLDLDSGQDGKGQFDLPKAARGGLKGAALAVFSPQGPRTPEGYARAKAEAEQKFELINGIAEKNPNRAAIAYTPADVRRLEKAGKFAVVISLLNTYSLGKDLDQIDAWYTRGVRIFGFVHAGHNDWADSSRPSAPLGDLTEEHGGLSELGKRAVIRLNELGAVIDVSQLSSKALADVLKLTKSPVAATHSAVRALVDATRNLSDDELLAIQRNGGVVQIVAFSNYLRPLPSAVEAESAALRKEFGFVEGQKPPALTTAQRAEYSKRSHDILSTVPPATLAQYVDHIDYAVKKIGIDHVGIASDFNHGAGVTGYNNSGEALNVTVELLKRGYKEQDLAKLWGGNFLRVWEKAQAQKLISRRASAR